MRARVALLILAWTGCERGIDVALTQQIEVQRLTADMRVQLHASAEAVQRAIMADTDEAANDFAREAREAADALEADRHAIEVLLEKTGSSDEQHQARDFGSAFGRLQELDRTLLELAIENTNAKAQRLSFGPAREAADALRDHLERAARFAPAKDFFHAQLLAARAELGIREIQTLHAPHIAEADDAVMTQLEQQMADSESAARSALAELSQLLGAAAASELGAAREQLDRFAQIHREIMAFSRKNSDVRSLGSALGEKRQLTAACDAALVALQNEVAKHGFRATR
jgi:hypothetical protein